MKGVNSYANKFPATCYKCGKQIPKGAGRVVPWRKETAEPMRVQCFEHVENYLPPRVDSIKIKMRKP